MEKIILSRDNIEKNREKILEAYAAPSKSSNKLPTPTKKQRKLLGMGRDRGTATAKYIRIAPRKVRVVANLIKGKSLDDAYAILTYTPKAASPVIAKVLKSAEANAVNNFDLSRDKLYVADCISNPGPVLKRGRIASRRGFVRIMKRTTHITIGVSEKA